MKIRIVLADDHKLVRDGIRTLLTPFPEIEIIAEAETGRQAVEACIAHRPDLVLMDLAMPDMNGIEATQQITRNVPKTRVLVLSMHPDKASISRAITAGASGYLLKDCDIDEIVKAIRQIRDGRTFLSPGIDPAGLPRFTENRSEASSPLTPREREVLQLIAEEKTSKEIAKILGVSVKTVETHRQQMMEKLNIHTIAGLTKYALKEGISF